MKDKSERILRVRECRIFAVFIQCVCALCECFSLCVCCCCLLACNGNSGQQKQSATADAALDADDDDEHICIGGGKLSRASSSSSSDEKNGNSGERALDSLLIHSLTGGTNRTRSQSLLLLPVESLCANFSLLSHSRADRRATEFACYVMTDRLTHN